MKPITLVTGMMRDGVLYEVTTVIHDHQNVEVTEKKVKDLREKEERDEQKKPLV